MVKAKRSRQREIILEVLRGTKEHPDANRVYCEVRKEIPKISLATVYRNLSKMVDDGTIQRLDVDSDSVHYDADTGLHYHLLCRTCQRIIDIPAGNFGDYIGKIESECGVAIASHSVTFYGFCKLCKKENN